jgi:hypothetical protein
MAKANDLRNRMTNQSTKLGAAAGGVGGKAGAGQSELSRLVAEEAKKKSGAQSTGHVLNKQLGGGGGGHAPHGPAGGSGGAKGVPRRPATNKGP